MTLKEFSTKYDIPYNIVYDASYGLKPNSWMVRDRKFNDDELFQSVNALLDQRIYNCEKKASRLRAIKAKLKKEE